MVDSFIYQSNPLSNTDNAPKYYTLKGYEEYFDNENNPMQKTENQFTQAKAIPKLDGSYRYFLKITGDGKPYNILSEYTNVRNPTLLKIIGKDQAQYKEVNYKVFDMYLKFLQTKNTSWLHNTEREMI